MMNMNVHSQPKKSLTYWELVRKKFFRKPYAVIGTFVVISIVILGIFAPFFSPYSPTRTDRERQYFPPQTLHFLTKKEISTQDLLCTESLRKWTPIPMNFHSCPIQIKNFSFIFLPKENRGIFWVLIWKQDYLVLIERRENTFI